MLSTLSLEIPICVACGSEMTHVLRHGYRRCDECVANGAPHLLALARGVKAAKIRALGSFDDYDPAGCAAAA
jgi:hypothetical protein